MHTDRDKFLLETIGKCAHEWHSACGCCPGICTKCGADEASTDEIAFVDWDGYGELNAYLHDKELLTEFVGWLHDTDYLGTSSHPSSATWSAWEHLSPSERADAVFVFLQVWG